MDKERNFKFEKIDSKEKAYTLGVILCKASINQQKCVDLAVPLKDKEIAELVSQVIGGEVHMERGFNKSMRVFPGARVTKKISDVTVYTGAEKKSERHYPRVRQDLEKFLLQGVFDADGCLTWGRRKDKNRVWQKISFISSLGILSGVQQMLLNQLGVASALRPKSNSNYYVLSINNRRDVLKVMSFLYPDDSFIILKRKYLKYCALRLELEENGEYGSLREYRAEPAEQEGVETNGACASRLNDRNSIQAHDVG